MPDRRQILETIYEAFGDGELESVRHHARDDIEVVERLEVPGAHVYQGLDDLEAGVAKEAETIDKFDVELHGIEEIGTRVVADVTFSFRGKGSGVEVGERLAHLVDFDGDKVARWRAFSTLEEARHTAMKEEIADLYRLWEEGRTGEALTRVHERFESVEPAETIGAQSRLGREEALRGINEWQESFDSFENELRGIEVVDNRVLVSSIQRMRGGGSSVAVTSDIFHVWEFRDGLPARMEMYYRRDQALEAAKSKPEPSS